MMLVVQCWNDVDILSAEQKSSRAYDDKKVQSSESDILRYSNSMCKKFYPHSQFSFIIFFPHFHSCFCCLSLILISEIEFFPFFRRRYILLLLAVDESLVGSVFFFCSPCAMMRNTETLWWIVFLFSAYSQYFLHEMRCDDIKDTSTKRRIFIKYFSSSARRQLPFFASFHFWDCFFYVVKSDVDDDEVQVVQWV